jgi:predicted nucleic acid-binding protein
MIVDSNILLHLFNPEDEDRDRVIEAFDRLSLDASPRINPVIFAEISPGFDSHDEVYRAISGLGVEVEPLINADAYRAGQAFIAYRRNGGPRVAILPDFLIGAQAAARGWPILTRDPRRFRTYFPDVELIDPLAPG